MGFPGSGVVVHHADIEDALRAEIDELRRIRSNMADVIVQQEEEIDKFNAWQEKAVNLYPDLERLE